MTIPEVKIYTDGACSPNPGPGGWGAVLLFKDGRQEELSGSEPRSTNNRMELSAALLALEHLTESHRITLYTDSKYVKDGITTWIHGWKQRGWLTAAREPVKNRDLWELLEAELLRHQVNWHWVRGHAENRWNERADSLAVAARQGKSTSGSIVCCPSEQGASASSLVLEADEAVHLYIGVSCRQAAGLGAWTAIFYYRGHYRICGCRRDGISANRLYVEAAVEALRQLKRPLPVHLYTSSGYLKNGAEKWLAGWRAKRWRNTEGEEIGNREQWQQLDGLLRTYPVVFHLVDKAENPPCHSLEAKELAREWTTG